MMATSIGKAKGHKQIAWRGSPNSYDEDIIAEYEDVMHRVNFPILPETADALISYIIENSVMASRINNEEPMPDEDDRDNKPFADFRFGPSKLPV